ncbi:MAG: penicillin-binding transpeptidase domain-containing protein, partial [Acidobacteriota bacterium]
IAESSNVGAIKVGTRLSPEIFYRYVRAFGFGERTGIGLPAEGDGLLRAPAHWSGLSQASMSIGQEISVTPLQILRAVAAVGNGGVLVQPYIVATAPRPDAARRVISPATARTLNLLLEGVVGHGTGKHAAVPGYRVAGKTGTAQKADGANGYGDRHVASFVGYVPARDPALAILIVLDSPRGPYHGGEIAAPVFPRVALPALRRLGVPPDVPSAHARTLTLVRGQEPPAPAYREQPAATATPRNDDGNPLVPDLAGSTAREALAALARAGLTARIRGEGRVASQDPPAGRAVAEGSAVRLLLSNRVRRAGGETPADGGRERAG